jgi:hypothetical protein
MSINPLTCPFPHKEAADHPYYCPDKKMSSQDLMQMEFDYAAHKYLFYLSEPRSNYANLRVIIQLKLFLKKLKEFTFGILKERDIMTF